MQAIEVAQALAGVETLGRGSMQAPEEVTAMLRLAQAGVGVSRRYERGSMLITSNRLVSEWGTVFGDPVVATAILDRLLHHSHVITIRGESYRLREKRRSGLVHKAGARGHRSAGLGGRGNYSGVRPASGPYGFGGSAAKPGYCGSTWSEPFVPRLFGRWAIARFETRRRIAHVSLDRGRSASLSVRGYRHRLRGHVSASDARHPCTCACRRFAFVYRISRHRIRYRGQAGLLGHDFVGHDVCTRVPDRTGNRRDDAKIWKETESAREIVDKETGRF